MYELCIRDTTYETDQELKFYFQELKDVLDFITVTDSHSNKRLNYEIIVV